MMEILKILGKSKQKGGEDPFGGFGEDKKKIMNRSFLTKKREEGMSKKKRKYVGNWEKKKSWMK